MSLRECIIAARTAGPLANADGTTTVEFCFRADEPVFAGHFPGRPMLPGIFQLEMTRVAAEVTLGCPLAISEVTRAKFISPVQPGETVRVKLKCSETPAAIRAHATLLVAERKAGEVILQLERNA